VLDVIEEAELTERAQEIGDLIIGRLDALAIEARFSCIGDTRQLGAMVAMELVKDRESRDPDPELTRAVVQTAARRGLIILACGVHGNVIRFLAPLTASDEIVREGLGILEHTLADPKQNALEVWEACIDDYVEYLEEDVGWAIRRVIQGLPELRDIDRRDNDRRARKIASALRAHGARANGRRLEAVGRLLIETTSAAIDDAWSRDGRVPSSVARELKLMHRSYLARYVE